jgi:hypothetical protein
MSVVVPYLVLLRVQWLGTQKYLQPFVNVSGLSEAAAIAPTTLSFVNQTAAGNMLPPVTFKLFDANGIAVAGGITVIRVRIVRKKVSAAVGALRYIAIFSLTVTVALHVMRICHNSFFL